MLRFNYNKKLAGTPSDLSECRTTPGASRQRLIQVPSPVR